ncbi:MAG: hypothetical protein KGD64_08005 [Candidatus Heimdallarchaeota archaeon]|nr:hypothetical protein [Candidatus Heimdallarchaeota archaeon]
MSEKSIITRLLNSTEPAVQLKTYLCLLEHNYDTSEVSSLTADIKKKSPLISNLFYYLPKDQTGKILPFYTKWQGIHWILSQLADIGYPPGDKEIVPSIDYEMNWLSGRKIQHIINGRARFCASIDAYGIYSAVSLGFFDERSKLLVDKLVEHQWADGGWNCDKKPEVNISSYHESLIPLRALNSYSKLDKNQQLTTAIDRASELFLKRRLYKRLRDDRIINNKWLLLHYPAYWHYDILMALKVLSEAGKVVDKRCNDALDLLESKRVADGGFPKEAKYCQSANAEKRYFSPGNWMSVNKKKMNEWVTIDALFILKAANRIDLDY